MTEAMFNRRFQNLFFVIIFLLIMRVLSHRCFNWMSCFNLFVVHLGVVLVCLLFLFHCVFSLAISFLFTVVCKWSVSLLLSFFDYLLLLMYFVAFVSKVFLSSSVGVFFFLGCRFPPFFFNVFYLHCRLLCYIFFCNKVLYCRFQNFST